MKVISHRGYWLNPEEMNSAEAFRRSFAKGYGTETDVRDCGGRLLISHDPPAGTELNLGEMLSMAESAAQPITLALNIKADGLAPHIRRELRARPSLDCFVFDMSVPDMRAYIAAGVPVFTRMSEVEREPTWLERAAGVWLDSFDSVWFGNEVIERLLAVGKRVCVVSSELHRREHLGLWEQLLPLAAYPGLMLCTDMPEAAHRHFQ